MRRITFILALAAVCSFVRAVTRIPIDDGWRFAIGDEKGAEANGFDDAKWTAVRLPHDWSIAGPFDAKNPAGGAGGFLPTGVAWYRKALPAVENGLRVSVAFDGIQANGTVYLNGEQLGSRPSGYVPQVYDLTGKLKPSGNVLAVRVDTSKQPASRWYAGSGINRHVGLLVSNPVHIGHDETFVTTPAVGKDSAVVRVRTVVLNQSDIERTVTVAATVHGPAGSAPDGAYAASGESENVAIAAGKSAEVTVEVKLPWAPRLWDLDHPDMHEAVVRVMDDGKATDQETVKFGIRDFTFEPATGFWLNGRNFKLLGVCVHEDASALGNAVPIGAWERRLTTLKSLGVNAIRPSHNPFSPEFLDLCDRVGLLVMDEMFDCWTVGKNKYDYHLYFRDWSLKDLADVVRRDRNHPSIVLYSAGNEIHDTPKADIAIPILKGLVEAFHKNDPTRPVTQALFRPNVSHDYDNGLADLLDVVGTNYRDAELLAAYQQKPTRKIIGTENGHDRKNWLLMRDNPQHAGQFLWTGVDYLGEARSWPMVAAGSGLLDRTGYVKPAGWERASWWAERPVVFACRRVAPAGRTPDDPGFEPLKRPQTQFPDWTPTSLEAHLETVEVYSNCSAVELKLNGKSLGTKEINKDASARVWKVPFQAGTLEALGMEGEGNVIASQNLTTAGKPAKVLLTAESSSLKKDWDEVAYVTATVVDQQGVPVPTADHDVTFTVSGPGVIAAVDSADNASHEPFQANHRKAYQGRCVAIVRATSDAGEITISASAEGLDGSNVSIKATKE